MGLFSGSKSSSSTTQNTENISVDKRIAAEAPVVSAENSSVSQSLTINNTVTDMGAGERAAALAESAVMGSAVVGQAAVTNSLNAAASVADRALGANSALSALAIDSVGKNSTEGQRMAYGFGGKALDANSDALRRSLDFGGQVMDTGFDFAREAFDYGSKASASAMAAIQRSAADSIGGAQRAFEKAIEGVQDASKASAAATSRSADSIAAAYQKTQDSATGNRTLYMAGIVVAGLAAILVFGPKLKG